MLKKYGAYALIAGLAIAVLMGLFPRLESEWARVALVVLGLVGGALNVKSERVNEFLMAGVALMLAATVRQELTKLTRIGDTLEVILANVFIVTAAATLVLAVKTIVSSARDTKRD
jgi:hypothetical protein